MRQVDSKSRIVIRLSVFLGVAVLLAAAGCRENPEDKAARRLHEQISEALAESDAATAQQQVQSAMAANRTTGLAQDSANLVSGNLLLNQGISLQTELNLKTTPIHKAADAIALQLVQSQQWLLEKERIEKMLALQNSEITELKTLISGVADRPGLTATLDETRNELNNLLSRKQTVQKELDAIQAVLDDYQMRSESLLKEAELVTGDRKLSLQQQAYAMLLSRRDDHVQAQAAENRMAILNNQIALVQSRIRLLEKDLDQTQAKIKELEALPARSELRDQLTEIEQLLSTHQQNMYAYADRIKSDLDAYRQAARQICDIFRQAAEHYAGVRSADAALAASVRQGESSACAAIICAEKMILLNDVAARLSEMIAAADEEMVRGLAERLPLGAQIDPEQIEEVKTFFEQADEAYENAIGQAQRLRQGADETAVSILKSRLLALYRKMQLADAMAQYDLAAQTQQYLEELKEQGRQEYGSLFSQSETASLLEKGLDYTPSLPVNVELLFESIRTKLTEWRQLPTPEQQAAAVAENLAEMQRLIQAHGEQMQQLLEPLKVEMEAAKERGFEIQTPAQPQDTGLDDAPPAVDDGFAVPQGQF